MKTRVNALDPTRLTTFAMDNSWDRASAASSTWSASTTAPTRWRPITREHPGQPIYRLGDRQHGLDARRICQRRRARMSCAPTTPSIRGGRRPRRLVDDRRPSARTSPAASSGPGSTIAASRRPIPRCPSISSQFGVLDTCGFPKDNFYYYRAWWRPDRRWSICCRTGPGRGARASRSKSGRTATATGGRAAGSTARSLGARRCRATGISNGACPMRRGGSRRIGYNGGKRGRARRARDRRAGAVGAADRRPPHARADGSDVVDAQRGEWSTRAGGRCRKPTICCASRSAAATIIGVGNGSPMSLEPDAASERRAFNGLAQAILRVGKRAGPIGASVTSDGLAGSSAHILALPVQGEAP